jgi:hypothetical protein
MKIKIDQELLDVDGQSINAGPKPKLFLRDVCINATLAPIQDDDEKKKWEKYEIFKKLRDAKDEVELKAEEITIIKKVIGKLNAPLIMGQCFEMLENVK